MAWEVVDSVGGEKDRHIEITDRLKVPGGWLYRSTIYRLDAGTLVTSSVFVPGDDSSLNEEA